MVHLVVLQLVVLQAQAVSFLEVVPLPFLVVVLACLGEVRALVGHLGQDLGLLPSLGASFQVQIHFFDAGSATCSSRLLV